MKMTRNRHQTSSVSKQIRILPKPDFTPKLPSKDTLASKALALMLEGKKLSHPDFENETSSWRLAAHIYVLKKLGWPIQALKIQAYTKGSIQRCIQQYFFTGNIIRKFAKLAKEVRHV